MLIETFIEQISNFFFKLFVLLIFLIKNLEYLIQPVTILVRAVQYCEAQAFIIRRTNYD